MLRFKARSVQIRSWLEGFNWSPGVTLRDGLKDLGDGTHDYLGSKQIPVPAGEPKDEV